MNDPAIHHVDVAVVGGGLAGLIAALTARRHAGGAATISIVTGSDPGGRARCDQRDGFVFNRGPRALYVGGPADTVLTDLGVDTTTGGPPATSDIMAWSGGELTRLPQGPIGLLRTPLFHGRDRARMGLLLGRLGRLDTSALAGQTVSEWVDSVGVSADAGAVAHMLVRLATYTNAPDLVDASAAVANVKLALGRGVRYLDGGWQTIVDQLQAAAHDSAIEMITGTAVSVEPTDGGSTVITTTARQVHAASTVLAAGSAANCASLLGRTPLSWDTSLPPAAVACLELGLRRPPPHRAVFGIDEPFYFSTHGPPARLGADGAAVVHVMAYLPVDDRTSARDRKAQLEAFARGAGVADDNILTKRFLARMEAQSAIPAAHPRGLAGRPATNVPDSPGVFVAGDWVGDTGLLADAVAASAADAGRRAAQHSSATLVA